MSIPSYSALKARIQGPEEKVRISKASPTTIAGRPYTTWLAGGIPAAGTAPTTAAVPTNATTGALGQKNPTGTRRVIDIVLAWAAGGGGLMTLADRLSHQGGLSGTTTGAQATNLPTAALTRYTTGVGVMLGADIHTAVGSTGTTITASYTDQDGTAGNATPLVVFGGTGFSAASRRILLPLADGDTGVRAVASVTLAASTLTAGAFGVTLFYPLISVPVDNFGRPSAYGIPQQESSDTPFLKYGIAPQIVSGACYEFLVHTQGTTFTLATGHIAFAED